MTRLIDADELKKVVFAKTNGMEDLWDTAGVCNLINNAPTVEDEDIFNEFLNAHMLAVIPAETLVALQSGCDRSDRQGRWKEFIMPMPLSDGHYKMGVICSECNTTWDCSTNYCPHCGARMQAGDDE